MLLLKELIMCIYLYCFLSIIFCFVFLFCLFCNEFVKDVLEVNIVDFELLFSDIDFFDYELNFDY